MSVRVKSPFSFSQNFSQPGLLWIQVRAVALANLKTRYRRTWAGFLWVLLNPLFMFGVQSYVFKNILRMEIPNYSLFLASGLLPWIFIVQSLEMSASIFINQSQTIKSYAVSPIVFLFAQLLDSKINFLVSYFLVLLPLMAYYGQWSFNLFLLPIAIVVLFIFVVSLASIIAQLQTMLRDTHFLMSFSLNIFYFLTPMFYRTEILPPHFRWIVEINPFFIMLKPFQKIVLNESFATVSVALTKSTCLAVALALVATFFWKSNSRTIYFRI